VRVKDLRPWISAGVLVWANMAGWLPGRWVKEAVCAQTDPEAFFPEGKGQTWRAAAKLCDGCPVKEMCLSYAVITDERIGVWGGLSQKQRFRLTSIRVPGTNVEVQLPKRRPGPVSGLDGQVLELTAGDASAASIARVAGVSERSVQRARRRAREAGMQVEAAA